MELVRSDPLLNVGSGCDDENLEHNLLFTEDVKGIVQLREAVLKLIVPCPLFRMALQFGQ